jgi:rod shape determining protein RodA
MSILAPASSPSSSAVADRRRNRPDTVLLASVVALSSFGLLMIYSATRVARELEQELSTVDMERQMIFFTAGLIAMLGFSFVDYRELRNFLPLIYGATVLALVVVFFFPEVNGSHRWIPLGPFALQPAEFAKVITILGVATLISHNREQQRLPWRTIAAAVVMMGVPGYLILRQPDLGTTMTFPFILLAMLFVGGMNWKQLSWIVAGGVVTVVAAFRLDLFADHQMNRIRVFLDPSVDPQGIGFQLQQSKLAIGSGQVFGKGLFVGTQTAVPEQETDFIFSVIGEQFGFIGGLLVILVFLIVVWRLFVIAAHARDRFGAVVAVGIAAMIAFHVFVNVGMTIGIAPVTGVPLPFISQGGSFFLAMSIAVGIANSIWLRRSPVPGETYIV